MLTGSMNAEEDRQHTELSWTLSLLLFRVNDRQLRSWKASGEQREGSPVHRHDFLTRDRRR